MSSKYPLVLDDRRTYAADFRGRVFIFDIDKTYLETRFSSMSGLIKIPIEFAIDKKTVAGMADILMRIRRGPGKNIECCPLYFISASPIEMRSVIERKMQLDGVEYDGFCFKNWRQVLLSGRFKRLKNQLGFKVAALLTTRLARPNSKEVLFGDDVEHDAEAFSLYAHLINDKPSPLDAEAALAASHVPHFDRGPIHALLDQLGRHEGKVERIFIRKTQPKNISVLHSGLAISTFESADQLAESLQAAGMIH